jgi:hypothetical protein
MKACGIGKLISCLSVCLVAAVGGSASYPGMAALGGSDTAPPAESTQAKPVELIRPKVGFVLQRVGARYEPVLHYHQAFRLPGTSMRFGSYRYLIPEDEELGAPKWGFLRDDGKFFYVNEYAASDSDPHYALAGNYFIVDGGAGGSGICRSMYLFRHDKDFMRLIDVVDETYEAFSPPGFISDYPGEPAYGHRLGTKHDDVPVWVITEKDRQGHPLIRLSMIRDLPPPFLGPQEFEVFHIYLKIVNGRLRVALDPGLYETLFDSVKEEGGPDSRSTEYYVSGFLSGKLSLARIKAELGDKKHRQWLVDSLRHVRRWDEALHKRYGHPLPRVIEYKLNRR